MKISNFERGNESWSADIRVTLLCNTTVNVGASVRVDSADVLMYFDGLVIGSGEFGPVTFSPSSTRTLSGTVVALDRPLDSAAVVQKYLDGQAINVTANVERIKVWGISVVLCGDVRIVNKVMRL
eukprot:m51a1_g3403 hypothetical protein (125) ;mRNA; f:552423-552876